MWSHVLGARAFLCLAVGQGEHWWRRENSSRVSRSIIDDAQVARSARASSRRGVHSARNGGADSGYRRLVGGLGPRAEQPERARAGQPVGTRVGQIGWSGGRRGRGAIGWLERRQAAGGRCVPMMVDSGAQEAAMPAAARVLSAAAGASGSCIVRGTVLL